MSLNMVHLFFRFFFRLQQTTSFVREVLKFIVVAKKCEMSQNNFFLNKMCQIKSQWGKHLKGSA